MTKKTKNSRDNFSPTIKLLLAQRVGSLCSHPECRRPTFGPAKGAEKVVNIGEAAHITAAAAEGPRYNQLLSPDERKSYSNGIWMCRIHARQVDADEKHFPVQLLQEWKRNAEEAAFNAITSGNARPLEVVIKLDLELELLERLGFVSDSDIEVLTKRLREAARADIRAFKNVKTWPAHALLLNLRVRDSETPSFNVLKCAEGLEASRELAIEAQPGMGKSTITVQLTEALLASPEKVAVFVPLVEWSSQANNILESLTHRVSFRGVREEDFMFLAAQGRLALVLDGWNELDSTCRKRAIVEINRLRREFPLVQLVISTRKQVLDVPILGPIIEIQQLSENQQLDLAKVMAGVRGEALIHQAWQILGLRELVSIPFYLKTFLDCTPGRVMPTTKEEILHQFVIKQESLLENAEIMHTQLHDLQGDLMTALAVEAMIRGNTSISENRARIVICKTEEELKNLGQITERPQPALVLDVLVSHHILIRSSKGFSFQHEQFQEWYASFHVEKLMCAAVAGCSDSTRSFRANILNMPTWAEAIFFCCERLSRIDMRGAEAVAAAVIEALSIDPILAAEMIARSSSEVWKKISNKIITFATQWHLPGKLDRALRFMLTTGKGEFASYVWPFVANSDSQIHLSIFHFVKQFKLTVLGQSVEDKISKLPDEVRKHVLSWLAFDSGIEGMELAMELAKRDPNLNIQFAVVEALQFRHSDRLVSEILKDATPALWSLLAEKGYANEIADPGAAERLRQEERFIKENHPNILQRLVFLSKSKSLNTEIAKVIETLISSSELPVKEQNAGIVIAKASKNHSAAVVSGLVHRLSKGLPLPFRSEELLAVAPIIDDGPIVSVAINPETSPDIANYAVRVIGIKSVGVLISQLLKLKQGASEEQRKRYFYLIDLISLTRQEAFVEAWLIRSKMLIRSKTQDPGKIARLANLIARHGYDGPYKDILQFNDVSRSRIIKALQHLGGILLKSSGATRFQFAELARAIRRIPSSKLTDILTQLAAEDLTRWHHARANFKPGATIGADTSTFYGGEYCRALAAITDDAAVGFLKKYLRDHFFGYEAAVALRLVWNLTQGIISSERLRDNSDFPNIKFCRQRRLIMPAEACQLAEPIFAVIKEFAGPEQEKVNQLHALRLAEVAFSMPYADKEGLIASLFTLNLPIEDKCKFFTVLVLSGEIINADIILNEIKAFLNAAKKDSWMLQENNRWPIRSCLELLAFTDRPTAILEAVDIFPLSLHSLELRRVLSSLANAPDSESEYILGELAKRNPLLIDEYDWMDAMLCRNTESACLMLLDLYCDPKRVAIKDRIDYWTFSTRLANFVGERPNLRAELLRRYQDPIFISYHSIIEDVLAKTSDESIVLAMVQNYALRRRSFDGLLRTAIENVALGRQPTPSWPGAYKLYGIPIPELRKKLFALIEGEASHLACASLILIDEIRDEHGRIDFEPRHPDIETGRQWPHLSIKCG